MNKIDPLKFVKEIQKRVKDLSKKIGGLKTEKAKQIQKGLKEIDEKIDEKFKVDKEEKKPEDENKTNHEN